MLKGTPVPAASGAVNIERNWPPMAIVRLNYAVDLRYGILVDLALKVKNGTPVDVRMGAVNVIWQGDAAAQVGQSLQEASVPMKCCAGRAF